jgi:hypothetical protein
MAKDKMKPVYKSLLDKGELLLLFRCCSCCCCCCFVVVVVAELLLFLFSWVIQLKKVTFKSTHLLLWEERKMRVSYKNVTEGRERKCAKKCHAFFEWPTLVINQLDHFSPILLLYSLRT